MKVYLVKSLDYSERILAICATKELAERELFKARDLLIQQLDKIISRREHQDEFDLACIRSYQIIIKRLSNPDYTSWYDYTLDRNMYSHETFMIKECTVIEN